MNNTNKYFFLSGLFFVAFLVLECTDMYGNSGWVKAFMLMLSTTFLLSGIAKRQKKDSNS